MLWHLFCTSESGISVWRRGGGTHFTPQNWTFFWTFINVHLALYAPPFLKQKTRTPKIGFVTIMLLKRIFDPKKL